MTEASDTDDARDDELEPESSARPTEAPPPMEDTQVDDSDLQDRLKEQLLRTAADFDNYRKRSRRDLEDAVRRAREDTLREILPIVDDLERAVAAADAATDARAIADGVKLVLKAFEEIAGRFQLQRVEAVGQRFDPNLHDAVQQQPTTDHEPGTIVAEITAGYRVGERLLRPALVVVAKRPEE